MPKKPDLTITITDKQLKAVAKGIKWSEIQAAIPELEARCNRKLETADDFRAAVKIVALKSKIHPSALSAWITARCKDNVQKKRAYVEQLSLLFDAKE